MSEVSTSLVQATESAPIEGIKAAEQAPESQAPEVKVPESKEPEFLAPKFAALTRKEREIRQMEKAVKAQQAEIEKMRSEWEQKSKASQDQESQLLKKMRENPLKFMKEHGLTFEELTQMQLNDENPTPEMQMRKLKEELENGYKTELEQLKQQMKEKEEKEAKDQWEKAVTAYKGELENFVKNNTDTYELVASRPNGVELMFETAQSFYEQTGEVPEIEKLAKAVEEHFEEEAKQILKLKKFQTAQAPKAPEAKTKEAAPTLSNVLSAQTPKSGEKYLSDEESKKRAAALIRWNE